VYLVQVSHCIPHPSHDKMPFNPDECYCAICDLYFSSLAQRMEHIQASTDHPECDYCKRRFLNKNILRNVRSLPFLTFFFAFLICSLS
jgi:hypothetical protein